MVSERVMLKREKPVLNAIGHFVRDVLQKHLPRLYGRYDIW